MSGEDKKQSKWKTFTKTFFKEGQFLMGSPKEEAPPKEDLPWYYRWLPYWIYKNIVWRRTFLFGALFPAVLVHIFWWTFMAVENNWYLFEDRWPITVTMFFGSFLAGASSEGGGAIAFPIMTLVLEVLPAVARDFSMLIQAFGMNAASFLILYLRIEIEPRVLLWSTIGGSAGVMLGLEFVAPEIPPKYTKVTFISVWMSFVVALIWLNYGAFKGLTRKVYLRIPNFNWWKALTLIVFGFAGGLLTSLTGSGIDLCTFSVLTLLFRVSEKTSTPTSVILMAINSTIGVIYKASALKLEPEAIDYLWCAVPVVVIFAPMGAFVISFCHRLVHTVLVIVTDTFQFVAGLIIIDMSPALWGTCGAGFGFGAILWTVLYFLGRIFLRKQIAKGHLPYGEDPDGDEHIIPTDQQKNSKSDIEQSTVLRDTMDD